MSRIRADRVTNKEGTGAPLFPNGIRVVGLTSLSNVVAGVATFTSDVSIGGTLTYEDVTNIDSVGLITARSGIKVTAGGINAVGVITATSFSGSGANLTGIDATSLKDSSDNIIAQATSTGIGIGTVTPANLLEIQGANGAGGLRLTETNHTNLNRHGRIFEYAGGLYFQSRNDTANGDFIFRGGLDGVEKLRIGSSSQIGIAGANYGTSGQVLTSGGASAAPQWADAGGVWTLINNINIQSNQSALDTSFGANAGITTSYAQIKVYYNIWLASGDKLYVRGGYGFNGNIAADIKTSDYWWSGFYHRAGETSMQWPTQGENLGYALISANNNKTQHSGEMIFDNAAGRMRVSGGASWPAMVYNCQGFSGGDNDAHNFTVSGQLKGGDNSPMSGFRIFSGGPSIVAGEVRTYGLSAT